MPNAKYRDNLVGADGKPLVQRAVPAAWPADLQRAEMDGDRLGRLDSADRRTAACTALVYADARYMSKFNTGSDLDIEKTQDAFTVVNAPYRRCRDRTIAGASKLWAQNLFDKNYKQVAFDAPIQGTPERPRAPSRRASSRARRSSTARSSASRGPSA